jgi:oligopeptide/dipeptide ABC transporter ATP-binding protein
LQVEFNTSRGRLKALCGITFEVMPGEIFGLVGETGCGKTVTGLAILRLISKPGQISAGRILFKGENLLDKSIEEMVKIRGSEISMIFQDPSSSLNPVFTAGYQIIHVIRQHQGGSNEQAKQRAVEVLEAIGLPDVHRLMDSYPHELSGGMQQRIMIGMALSSQPDLLIADEPTTALDVTIKAQIIELLRDLQLRFNLAILLITHDLGVVAETCDRLAILYAGHVVEIGTKIDLFSKPLHPYTRGLMAAIPTRHSHGHKLAAIKGTVPGNPGSLIGCPFESRCELAFDKCKSEPPPMFDNGNAHLSACWLLEQMEHQNG